MLAFSRFFGKGLVNEKLWETFDMKMIKYWLIIVYDGIDEIILYIIFVMSYFKHSDPQGYNYPHVPDSSESEADYLKLKLI